VRLAALALVALLATGCARTGMPTSAAMRTGVASAKAADPLAETLQALFAENFAKLDANGDGAWTAEELELSAGAFKRLLGAMDRDHDDVVTPAEYFPPARLKQIESEVRSRAEVSASGVGGRVNLAKGQMMFDVYLQDRMPEEAVRTWAIAEAFRAADADRTGVLKAPELEVAYAILEARADLTDLQRRLTAAAVGAR
jgi:hypothetical protein